MGILFYVTFCKIVPGNQLLRGPRLGKLLTVLLANELDNNMALNFIVRFYCLFWYLFVLSRSNMGCLEIK